jgi:hypothetical protein
MVRTGFKVAVAVALAMIALMALFYGALLSRAAILGTSDTALWVLFTAAVVCAATAGVLGRFAWRLFRSLQGE